MASDYGTPLSPYERELQRRMDERDNRDALLTQRTELLLATQPDRLSELVSLRNFDEDVQPFAVATLAKQVAENSLTIQNFNPELALQHVETKTIDKAVSEGFAAEEAHRQAEIHEAEKLRQETMQREAAAREAAAAAPSSEQGNPTQEKAGTAQPVRDPIERFNEILEARAVERETQHQLSDVNRVDTITIEQSRSDDQVRLTQEPERLALTHEMTDSRADRFARMFDQVSTDKVLDLTHDPNNALNYAHERGGRGD